MTTLSPSSIARLYQPSKCELRTWLRANDFESAPDSDFQVFIKEQGELHEGRVLERLTAGYPTIIDIDGYNNRDAAQQTSDAIDAADALIYQGQFVLDHEIDGKTTRILGYPDFLLPDGDGWIIADAKLAGTIFNPPRKRDGGRSPKASKKYIVLQLQLYGWMFEELFPDTPFKLHVYTGTGEIEEVEYDGGVEALEHLARILELEALTTEPVEVVGWTKCGGCGFREHCWPRAVSGDELGYVSDLQVTFAERLIAAGITSYPQILEQFTEESLAEFYANGKKVSESNRGSARKLIENVTALTTNKPVRRRDSEGELIALPPEVTAADNFVMFDLEGAKPDTDLPQFVYLWGMQVYGTEKGEFRGAISGFDEGGDEQAWFAFLAIAADLMEQHPGIRFVHWANYEKQMVEAYLKKYTDDAAGTGAKVLESLLDLYPITQDTFALPTPSYSLKVVEQAAGYTRQANEVVKGDQSIVAYTEARDTDDTDRQKEIMEAIRAYNEEDLEATWAVQQWLTGLGD